MSSSPKSPEAAAKSASRWNGLMAVGQVSMSAATGNIGFAAEAVHNASDAVSFDAKRRAMESSKKSKRLRRIAASILTIGGVAAATGGGYQLATNERENAESLAITMAVAGASINTLIARRTHQSHHPDHDSHSCGAHEDSKLHAITDAATGWIYVGGLAIEHKLPGAASLAVATNGIITTSAGAMTFKKIEQIAS